MKMRVDLIINGELPEEKSRELYERLRCYEAICVTNIIKETFVSASVNLSETDVDKIISICKEYGEVDADIEVVKPF